MEAVTDSFMAFNFQDETVHMLPQKWGSETKLGVYAPCRSLKPPLYVCCQITSWNQNALMVSTSVSVYFSIFLIKISLCLCQNKFSLLKSPSVM